MLKESFLDQEVKSKQWYVVYTKPRCEKKLKETLEKRSIQTYLPLITEKKKWSDRYKVISTPLFASYLFVYIDYLKDSLSILKDPYSVQFVGHTGKPATIDPGNLELIQIYLEEFPNRVKVEAEAKLRKGSVVEIKRGAFAGKKVKVEKIKNEYYVIVQLPMLNRTVLLEVKKEDLEF